MDMRRAALTLTVLAWAAPIAVPNVHSHELALDAAGNLYGEHLWYEGERTDRWSHRIWRRSPDGGVTDVIPAREGFLMCAG